MKWWNNGTKNTRSKDCPGAEWAEGRMGFKRKPHSPETNAKIATSLKGKPSWNKGKKDYLSDEVRQRMSDKAIANRNWERVDNTGRDSWNKGLTKETSDSVKAYAEKQKGQKRSGNYPVGENHPNFDPNTEEYKRYKMDVRRLTEITYRDNMEIINPENKKRGRSGEIGAYQLDHKTPIYIGFIKGILPEELAKLENLELITWEQNIRKWWDEDAKTI